MAMLKRSSASSNPITPNGWGALKQQDSSEEPSGTVAAEEEPEEVPDPSEVRE